MLIEMTHVVFPSYKHIYVLTIYNHPSRSGYNLGSNKIAKKKNPTTLNWVKVIGGQIKDLHSEQPISPIGMNKYRLYMYIYDGSVNTD